MKKILYTLGLLAILTSAMPTNAAEGCFAEPLNCPTEARCTAYATRGDQVTRCYRYVRYAICEVQNLQGWVVDTEAAICPECPNAEPALRQGAQ